MKKLSFIMLLMIATSCKEDADMTTYYANGHPKETVYKSGIQVDSIVYYFKDLKSAVKTIKYFKDGLVFHQRDFFENGRLMREGRLLKDNFRVGKWDFYSPDHYKNEVIEYMNIGGESYVNQVWRLNASGDTLLGANHYTLIRKKDSVYLNQPNRLHFFLNQRALPDSEAFVCIPLPKREVKSDFSDEADVRWDTIPNMSRQFSNHPTYKNWKHDVLFEIMPTKLGKDTIKGFLLEKEMVTGNDTIDFITRKIYFLIPYYVKNPEEE